MAYYYNSTPLRPRPGLAHYLIAEGLLRAGLYEAAIPELRKAVGESPRSVEYLTVLGAALRQVGKLKDAEQSLRSAIAIDDKAVDAHGYLASVLLVDGRKAEARVELRRAISLTSDQKKLATFRQMLSQTE